MSKITKSPTISALEAEDQAEDIEVYCMSEDVDLKDLLTQPREYLLAYILEQDQVADQLKVRIADLVRKLSIIAEIGKLI